jgi:hypothetical protein
MPVLRHRLAIAGVITAAAITVPAAALASGSGSPPGKPAPPQACAAGACQSKAGHPATITSAAPSQLTTLAASAGISTDRLQAGLAAAKRAGGNTVAGIAAFAASAGVSHTTAQRIVDAVFGTQVDRGKTGAPAVAAALASRLGVSTSAAQQAVTQLDALGEDGVDPASPAFAAIARDLGVSPVRLAAALDAVKQSEAGK